MTGIAMAAAGAMAASESSFLTNPGTQTYFDISLGSTSTSGIRIATDGDVDERNDAAYSDNGDWLLAGGTASDYEVQFAQNSGDTLAGDTLSTYHALSSSREVRLVTSTSETLAANITVTIRHATNTSDSISFTCTLSADESPL